MKWMTWPARILLTAAAAVTAVAGYRYASYSNRDSAVEAAYYLGVSARAGNADARARLEHLFPNDAKAQLAFEHGLQSPTSQALGAGEAEMDEPRLVHHARAHRRAAPLRLTHHPGVAPSAPSSASVTSAPAAGDDVAHPVPQPGADPDSPDSGRDLA